MAHKYCQDEQNKNTIIGNLISNISSINYFRDSQYQAIEVYLWIKEVAQNKPVSEIINSVVEYDLSSTTLKLIANTSHAGAYLYQYLKNNGINPNDFLDALVDKDVAEKCLSELLQEYDYTNYLYSLPMGAGKTYFIAACIYIDSYLYDRYSAIGDSRKDLYSTNSIVLIPNAKKSSIINSLATIKYFNPAVLFGEATGQIYKNKLRINIINEVDSNSDKLRNKNPNLSKIQQSIVGHYDYNVFIINAEKINSIRPKSNEEFDELKNAQQTMIEKAEDIREAFRMLPNLSIYVDEAHHIYDEPDQETMLRKAISDIHTSNMISCICVSGTPYLKAKRNIIIDNKKVDIEDIQDTIFYYPLNKGIGNFLKQPIVETVAEAKIVEEGLEKFFDDYNYTYSDGSCSKVAIYCVDSKHLQSVLETAKQFCLKNNMNPDATILPYYSDAVKDAPKLPEENTHYFYGLDNPTSTYRIILLIGIGTEGWDCKSLTGVILPRDKSGKIFVLQSSCRCLREKDDANSENAFICLSPKNKNKLTDELYKQYRMTLQDFTNKETREPVTKRYPITVLSKKNRTIKFNNIEISTELVIETIDTTVDKRIQQFSFGDFQNKFSYDTREEVLTIGEEIYEEAKTVKESQCNISFIKFLYKIVEQAFGSVTYEMLLANKQSLITMYDNMAESFTWFDRHPNRKIIDLYCYEIAKLFIPRRKYQYKDIPHGTSIQLLKWNIVNPFVTVSEPESRYVFPQMDWSAEITQASTKKRFDEIKGKNKDRMFNYYPLKTGSDYEIHMIVKMLNDSCIDDSKYELYYNGYTGGNKYVEGKTVELEKFQILTDVGIYTPDFLLLKLNGDDVQKILIIETKGETYENSEEFFAREEFVKTHFLSDKDNKEVFEYIRIGDVESDASAYNDLTKKIKTFFA